MSFIIAVSVSGFGIVMADTRLNFSSKNGDKDINDKGEFSLPINTDITLNWKAKYRKLAQTDNFIIASAGDAIFGKMVIDAIQNLNPNNIEKVQEIITNTKTETVNLIKKSIPNYTNNIDKTMFLVIEYENGNMVLKQVDSSGYIVQNKVNYIVNYPPELKEEKRAELNNYLTNKLSNINSLENFHQTISLMAKICSEVFNQSSTVAPYIETIVFNSTPEGHHQRSYLSGNSREVSLAKRHALSK